MPFVHGRRNNRNEQINQTVSGLQLYRHKRLTTKIHARDRELVGLKQRPLHMHSEDPNASFALFQRSCDSLRAQGSDEIPGHVEDRECVVLLQRIREPLRTLGSDRIET